MEREPIGEPRSKTRADGEPRAWDVCRAVAAARRQIDYGRAFARQQGGKLRTIDAQLWRRFGAEYGIVRPSCLAARLDENEHVLPSHPTQPGCGHEGAHLLIVDEDDARAEGADIMVRGLHQLTAGR